ncbi:MAG: tetratricopeptide repeat protein, partial [Methylococcales bacterium]|nr:tetratricopeptide repeat protein [Methylococcales bacterium]
MANSPRNIKDVAKVKIQLTTAKGYLELGDYDRAIRAYNRVLAIDPYNQAARRGMENVERHKMNYTDVARNHSRAARLRQIAQGWETPVPNYDDPDFILSDGDVQQGGQVFLEAKLKIIVIPQLEFSDARLVDVIEYLVQKSQELDASETDPLKKGVNIIVDTRGAAVDPSQKTLTISLSNVPLGVALQYAARQVGMKYVVDNYAVSVVPLSSATDAALVLRKFPVPPGFLSSSSPGGRGGGAQSNDPFAKQDANETGTLAKRVTAKEFLEQNGVTFGPGSLARLVGGTLMVKTSPEQMEIVKGLVQNAREGGSKNVEIRVKMISVQNSELKIGGLDFLLGNGSLGTDSVLFGGGTNGNSVAPALQADYPFSVAGLQPVTSGLRTGNFSTGQSIEDVLVGGVSNSGVSPGVFAVNGIFTDPQFGMVIR